MSIVFSPEESALIDHIAVKIELERLSPLERALIEFRFAAAIPDDYAGPWPAGKGATGVYLGDKYLGRQLSATTTHERTSRILAHWRRLYHKTRYHKLPARHPPAPMHHHPAPAPLPALHQKKAA